MGIYRYLVAFNYRQSAWPFSADNLQWLGYAASALALLFLWLSIKTRRLSAMSGLIATAGLLAFLYMDSLQDWYSRYLFIYGWTAVLLISTAELVAHKKAHHQAGLE